MKKQTFLRAFELLFETQNMEERGQYIQTYLFLDGESTGLYYNTDGKQIELKTDGNFSESLWLFYEYEKYLPYIEKICDRLGLSWDGEKGVLSLRFRRNDMTLSEAVMRMEEGIFALYSLRRTTYAPDEA